MDQFSGIYSVVIVVVGIFGWVASIAARRALVALDRESPEVLRGVDVPKVDFGFKCLRGVFLLGFSRHGDAVSSTRRWAFLSLVLAYAMLALTGLVMFAAR